ncbi:hypothetical protein SC171_21310 [Pantoea cypripedii]|uniref:hypothetical protein n=1 Tax=Pantoea cypripedii TaxID=55209 RepID=UPI002FC6E639
MGISLGPGTSYPVASLDIQSSKKTDSNKQSGITLLSASNSRDMPETNSSKASTRSSGEFVLNIAGNSSDDSGINTLTPNTVKREVTQFRKDQVQADIAKQKRESELFKASSSSASDATESTEEIVEPKLKFNAAELASAVSNMTKDITKLKKRAEQIKTYEQYAKVFATATDLATTVVLVAIAGTATGVTAIPLIIKLINLEKDLGSAILTHENCSRVRQDLPPVKYGTDFFEGIGRTIGKWGGLSEDDAVYKSKYISKWTGGFIDAAATASTIYAPILSGILKNANWYTSIGRVAFNWFINTVLAKGEAKKEEAKHMEEVLKVVVAHQQKMLDIKNAETEQNHAETVEKLNEANRVLSETKIVVDQKEITIGELISELTEKEKDLAESQTQHKTSEQLLTEAREKIDELQKFADNLKEQLDKNREMLAEQQANNFSLREEVTRANRLIYNLDPSPATDHRQRTSVRRKSFT